MDTELTNGLLDAQFGESYYRMLAARHRAWARALQVVTAIAGGSTAAMVLSDTVEWLRAPLAIVASIAATASMVFGFSEKEHACTVLALKYSALARRYRLLLIRKGDLRREDELIHLRSEMEMLIGEDPTPRNERVAAESHQSVIVQNGLDESPAGA